MLERRLAEFLSENYNVTDEESIGMYNALLEDDLYPELFLLEDKDSVAEYTISKEYKK